MKDEEKKNEYPVPSGGAVRTSYILFLIVMIFMLVFCALFLAPLRRRRATGRAAERRPATHPPRR